MKLNIQKMIAKTLILGMLVNAFLPTALLAEEQKSCLKPCKPKPKPCKNKFFKTVDYIIVGGGTAGLTCAWALTNDNKTSVLVLESGLDLTSDPEVLAPGAFTYSVDLTNDPKYAYTYATNPVPSPQEVYSDGHTLGGSSAHNGLQAVRGTPDIYNEWAVFNPIWSYANLLPLFINQEHYNPDGTIADPTQRGLSGRLYISQQTPLTDPFSAALAAGLGVPQIADYNDHYAIGTPPFYANTVGVSANQQFSTEFCPTQTCGVRSFSGNSYLKGITAAQGATPPVLPIVDAHNNGIGGRKLYVRTSVEVIRILFDGTRAIGVELIVNEGNSTKTLRTFAREGIILSAGSIRTPALLQLSGIGKPSDLAPLGINVILANDNVGYNLQNQYGPPVLVRNVCTTDMPPCATPPLFELNTAFHDLGVGDGVRRAQIDYFSGVFAFPSSIAATLGLTVDESQLTLNDIGLGNILVDTKSRGSVVIRSTNPLTDPYVNLNMYTDTAGVGGTSQDLADAVTIFKLAKQVAIAQPGGTYADVIYPPMDHYPAPYGTAPAGDNSFLEQDALHNIFIAYHACGTCRMSLTAATGVVDGSLKVHGLDNLYIADNSVQPQSTTGNTAYPAFFIGLNMAKILGATLP